MSGTPPLALRRLSTANGSFEADFQRVLHWSAETDAAIEQRVATLLDDVRTRGDAAFANHRIIRGNFCFQRE